MPPPNRVLFYECSVWRRSVNISFNNDIHPQFNEQAGHSVLANVTDFFPYFYVPYPRGLTDGDLESLRHYLNVSIVAEITQIQSDNQLRIKWVKAIIWCGRSKGFPRNLCGATEGTNGSLFWSWRFPPRPIYRKSEMSIFYLGILHAEPDFYITHLRAGRMFIRGLRRCNLHIWK